MLKQISCDKFIECGEVRPPFIFTNGLNAVLGDSNESNSIGKSSLLMIIDFCFGGEDYVKKEADTIKEIGEHEIKFIFKFDKDYYFIRKTSDLSTVQLCNENYEPISDWTINHFKSWLSEKYNVAATDLTFRQVVSRFFRIYNRGTHNELRPLNTVVREDDKSGIEAMLKLYGLFGDIGDYDAKAKTAQLKKDFYNSLDKFEYKSIAANEKEKEANIREIEKLKKELETLNYDNNNALTDEDYITAGKKNDLKDQRRKIRQKIRQLEDSINEIEFDKNYDNKSFVRGYDKLLQFFPNANIEEISKIDDFHEKVQSILSKEFKSNKQEVMATISFLEQQVKEIDEQLAQYKASPNISKEICNRHTELTIKINALEDANKQFELKKQYTDECNKITEEFEHIVNAKTKALETTINSKMNEINSSFNNGRNYAPVLEINKLNSYSFYIPKDNGTGSRFKAVAIFDLAVLKTSKLPAFIHDSIVFNNIEKESREEMIRLYDSITDRQIFIAYDHFTENSEIQRILENKKVVELSDGEHCLFGRHWAEKE